MIKTIPFVGIGLLYGLFSYSQQATDSIQSKYLNEITIIGKTGLDSKNESKPLSSVDEYMEQQDKINLIRRGSYACEPVINNMSSERISVTIDGMKIFCACTDKMDPVNSYVEIINLSKMSVSSGMGGNPYASNSIGGSLDMKLNKAGFNEKNMKINANTGYETNGNYRILGGGLAFSRSWFYINSGIFYRISDNYQAGGKQEINFSQFDKLNLMSNAGFRFSGNRIIEGTIIYDIASNVGYPALTMDVKSAKGLITSLSYRKENLSGFLSELETKLYFNSITHIMDDSRRPNVLIRMDMPGQSKTYGYYSTLKGRNAQNSYTISFDSYYNRSLAEMTMYPNDPDNKPMFMYTWPDIRTFNSSVFLEDKFQLNPEIFIQASTKLSVQRDGIQSDFGFNTLQIFYPDMDRFQNRFIWNLAGKYLYYKENMQLKVGGGYGFRAPSPSESYGFYLFNAFDNYDYLGNPELSNESSLEANFSFSATKNKFRFNIDASCFYFYNYIIGRPNNKLSSMTINSSGVKVYENLNHATILNIDVNTNYSLLNYFKWTNRASCSFGKDDNNNSLPLIAPFCYTSSLSYSRKQIFSEIKIQGAAKQGKYSIEYGEDQTPAYATFDASIGYEFPLEEYVSNVNIGVENLFDKKYSTYSDWNNILRKGRNIYINLMIKSL